MIFSADETADVGIDLATPVVGTIGAGRASRFNGTISRVTIEIEDLDDDTKAEHETAHNEGMRRIEFVRQ